MIQVRALKRRWERSTGPIKKRSDRRLSVQSETLSTTKKSGLCRRGIAGEYFMADAQSHERPEDLD
jgi:hypothetical protein